ncbi:hypothetical protein [Actinomadura sp. 6N118]|uniref:DUF4760 domain-containing protein n=1 Tax=Actinomadura sp. 6N118 TaxID=3375151 RepID=UPI003795608D
MSAWDAVSAISSMSGAVTVTAALIYTARQVREARRTRAVTALLAIHKAWNASELNRTRRRLKGGEFDDVDQMSIADRNAIGDVLNQAELVGFLVDRRLVSLHDVMSLFPSIPFSYEKALPHIEERRRAFPMYARNVEVLVRRYETQR